MKKINFVMGVLLLLSIEAKSQNGIITKPELLKKYDLLPVDKAYKAGDFSAKDYNKIIVKPVFTESDAKKSALAGTNMRTWLGKEKEDVAKFAKFTQKAFESAIRKDPNWSLVTKSGPKTLILELALVKIVPGKALYGAAKNTPVGFMFGKGAAVGSVAAKGAAAATESTSKGSGLASSVGIEGIIRDSVSNKVVVMVKDHASQKTAVFNAKDFSAYGNLEQIVNEWAALLVKCLNKRPLETGKKVERKGNLKLLN